MELTNLNKVGWVAVIPADRTYQTDNYLNRSEPRILKIDIPI